MKKLIALTLAVLIMMNGQVLFADPLQAKEVNEDVDYAPVIGEFVPDTSYEKELRYQESLADKYFLQKKHGGSKAIDTLMEIENLEGNTARYGSAVYADMARAASNSRKILAIYQVSQERDYWCGYAAMKSILDHQHITKTQYQIAKDVYDPNKALAWYKIDGSTYSQFPAAVGLKKYTGYAYKPYPYGAAGGTTINPSTLSSKVCTTIDRSRGVMCCGISSRDKSSLSHLPNYPLKRIGHWLAIRGYVNYGDKFSIADPAKSSAVTWSGAINAYMGLSKEQLAAFASSKGIIW